jgi:hypothetical protein
MAKQYVPHQESLQANTVECVSRLSEDTQVNKVGRQEHRVHTIRRCERGNRRTGVLCGPRLVKIEKSDKS